jgi:hypothetical protein
MMMMKFVLMMVMLVMVSADSKIPFLSTRQYVRRLTYVNGACNTLLLDSNQAILYPIDICQTQYYGSGAGGSTSKYVIIFLCCCLDLH